eukprot:scaffold151377_cov36-Prasinocladus_malaysianus.AAC.1
MSPSSAMKCLHRLKLPYAPSCMVNERAGPYMLRPEKDTIPSHQVEGLGAELRAKYGLDAMVQFDQHMTGDDLIRMHGKIGPDCLRLRHTLVVH